jgi:penicillin-binding protein 1A
MAVNPAWPMRSRRPAAPVCPACRGKAPRPGPVPIIAGPCRDLMPAPARAAASEAPRRPPWAGSGVAAGRPLGWVGGWCAGGGPAGGAAAGGVALAVAYPNLPEISSLTDYRPKLPLRVFSADGVLLGEFGEERRTFVPIAQMPQVMKDAVLAPRTRASTSTAASTTRAWLRAALEPTCATRAARARPPSRCRWRATSTCPPRRPSRARSTRSCWPEDRAPAEQGPDPRALHEPDLPRPARLRLRGGREIYFGKPLKDVTWPRRPCWPACPRRPRPTTRSPTRKRATRAPALHHRAHVRERLHHRGPARRGAGAAAALPHGPDRLPVHAEFVAETARQLVFAQYGEETYTRGLNVYLTVNSADQMVAYRACAAA